MSTMNEIQEQEATERITAYNRIPYNLISDEIQGTSKSEFFEELADIVNLYNVYEKGAKFITEGTNGDYVPAQLPYKIAKELIDKEARFFVSRPPDITVSPIDITNETDSSRVTIINTLISKVLKKNKFNSKLSKAAKDCFVGKRVAIILNFNDDGIKLTFLNSLEFYYENNPYNTDVLDKIVTFARLHDSRNASEVRIFKKSYWMENGYCHVKEDIYDGLGNVIEEVTPDSVTKFTHIPAIVILNDGLTGDSKGSSEIRELTDYESWFSRLSNADMDAERKSMNPVRYTIDCSPESTSDLSGAAGAYWDLQSDPNAVGDKTGQAGILEPNMTYSTALKSTLDRIKGTMHNILDVPNVSNEALQGMITSGKTLKAIYWGLMVRCDEKMLIWGDSLEQMTELIIEGAFLYPNSTTVYRIPKLEEVDYEITVTNNYPLPEDEQEEKATDLAEVANQTMSKKAYMKKWRNLTDQEIEEELRQIAEERAILEDSYSPIDTGSIYN